MQRVEGCTRRVVSRPETYFPRSADTLLAAMYSARGAACAELFFALLQLHVAARTDEGVTMRGRSRSGLSSIFDPPRQHLCSAKFPQPVILAARVGTRC